MPLRKKHIPILLRIFIFFPLLWILSACGSIQDTFSFQSMNLRPIIPSHLQKPNTIRYPLFLASADRFKEIPNAPILLFPPPDPPPEIPMERLLAPPEPHESQIPKKQTKLISTPTPSWEPSFSIGDDLDGASLIEAAENHLQLLNHTLPEKQWILGNRTVSNSQLKETLKAFLNLLRQNLPLKKFQRRILEDFEIISPNGKSNRKTLFTGYYTPVIEASRTRAPGYKYPIYEKPQNLARTRYIYRQRYKGEPYARLFFTEGPNFTREDIDGRHLLDNRHLEIAWVKDDMDRYFLHIQGSGLLQFPDGTFQAVNWRTDRYC